MEKLHGKRRHRNAKRVVDHMSHRHIHERHQKYHGYDQSCLHVFDILLLDGNGILRLPRLYCCFSVFFYRGTVSGMFHRLNNLSGIKLCLIILDLHAVCQQVDTDCLYALQFGNTLFHMGGTCRTAHACYVKLFLHVNLHF